MAKKKKAPKSKGKRVTIKGAGTLAPRTRAAKGGASRRRQRPMSFKKGALHRQLGVPEGEPIPASKKAAALSGKLGPLAKKRAGFAFKGALAAGRKTAPPGSSTHRGMSKTERSVWKSLKKRK